MASTVHYKFKSQKDYDSIEFDGMFISVGDLKRQIVDKRGLGRDQAMELQLTNAQTNEDYEDDAVLVWKNTSVIAKRVPRDQLAAVGSEVGSTTVKKTVYVPPPQIPAGTEFRKPPPRRNMTYIAPGAAGADGAPADTSADPSIAALVSGAASAWETEKAAASAMGRGAGRGGGRGVPGGGRGMGGRGRGMDTSGPPPPGYVCFRCSVPGHWIHQCPTNGDQNLDVVRMKTAYGIPQNRLEHTEDGVLVAPTGESTSFKADDDEFSRMMGFLTEREEAKAGTALPAPGDEGGGGGGDAAALPAPGDEAAVDGAGGGEGAAEDGAGAEDGANAEDGGGEGAGGENFQPPLPPGPPPPGAQQATANGMPGMMNPMMGMGGMGGMGMNPMMGMGMGMGMGMNPMMMNPMMGMMGMPGMDIMMNPMAGLAGGGRGGMGGRGGRGGRGIVAAPSGRGPGTAKGKPIKVVVRKKGVGPTGSAPRDSPGDRREDDEAEKRSGDENEDKDTAREGDDEGGADGDGDKKIDDSPPEKREVRRVVIKRDRDRNVRERSPEPSGPRRVVVVRKRARSPERARSPDRSREGSPDGDEGGGSGKKKRRNRGGKRRGGKGKGGGGGGGGGGGILSRLGK